MAVLGFDIDDTIADMTGFFIEMKYGRDSNGELSHPYERIDDEINAFVDHFGDEVFSKLRPLPYAIERINQLYGQGHRIVFITARFPDTRTITERWLNEWGIPYHELIFDMRKVGKCLNLGVRVFVDDKPRIIEAVHAVGINAVLMDLPKNRMVNVSDGIYRAGDWNEVYRYVANVTGEVDQ